jgi:hypothetical protein
MFENLNHPYPFNNNYKHNLRTIVLVSMGFMLLMLYFQPFGVNFMESASDGYFVLAAGILNAVVLFVSTLILPGMFPAMFDTNRWTIRKELIWNISMFFALAVSFSLAAMLFNIKGMVSLPLFRSAALALLPLVLFNLVNYNTAVREKFRKAFDSGKSWLSDESDHQVLKGEEQIMIQSENGKEVFNRNLKDIVLIQSASNYIEIFYREHAHIRKRLLRKTLQSVEKHLTEYHVIKKCHRCCLVNIDQIKQLVGAPSNYFLEVDGLDFRIPLSRHKVAEFRKLLALR